MALAPADCPTQLPAQYRRRWSVSRPCSGRERVGPLRKRHQGHSCSTDVKPCGLARSSRPRLQMVKGAVSTRGDNDPRSVSVRRMRRSCRPGVVHENG